MNDDLLAFEELEAGAIELHALANGKCGHLFLPIPNRILLDRVFKL